MFIERWTDKEDVVYTYSGIVLGHEKEQMVSFSATWMDLRIITPSEGSQTKASTVWYHLYAESKNDANELIYKVEIDSDNLWLPEGKWVGQ